MKKANYLKVAAVLLYAGVLAKRPTREVDMSMEGKERRHDRTTKHDEDELRVQRTEEELRAGTHEREAGEVSVRDRRALVKCLYLDAILPEVL